MSESQEIRLKLPAAEPHGYYGPVLQVDNVSCGYDKYAHAVPLVTDDARPQPADRGTEQ